MIALNSSQKFEIILAAPKATNDCPFVVTAIDSNASVSPVGIYSNVGNSNGTVAVDVAIAPASGNTRLIKSFMYYNADTDQVTLSPRLNQSSTLYVLGSFVLNVGDSLQYTPEEGFVVTDRFGTRRAGGYSGWSGTTGWSGTSGWSGTTGWSGTSGWSGIGTSGFSGYSAASPGPQGTSGYSGSNAAGNNFMPGGWS